MVKLIISGLGFYFHTYNFSFVKAQGFFILKYFLKLRFFQISWVFLKLRFFYRLEQRACHIPTYHDCWLKENEKKIALMIKMVSISFMLHVPLDSNY